MPGSLASLSWTDLLFGGNGMRGDMIQGLGPQHGQEMLWQEWLDSLGLSKGLKLEIMANKDDFGRPSSWQGECRKCVVGLEAHALSQAMGAGLVYMGFISRSKKRGWGWAGKDLIVVLGVSKFLYLGSYRILLL